MMLSFLDNWTIDLEQLKQFDYSEFKKPFTVKVDKKICELIISGIRPEITKEIVSNFINQTYKHIDNDEYLKVEHEQAFRLGRFYSRLQNPRLPTKDLSNTPVSNTKIG